MPTKNPRLTITMQPSLAAIVRELSALTGSSQGSLIAELLEQGTPVLERLVVTLRAAQSARADVRNKLAEDLSAAQQRIESQLGFAMEDFNQATAPLLSDVETVRRRRAKAAGEGPRLRGRVPAAGAVPTPMSNRGVRYVTQATGKIAQERVPVRVSPAKVRGKVRGVD